MPVARPETSDSRVIAHVGMDCFYVQVEQRKNPELRGLPTAVVQYNSWQGGGLIAVSYEARKYGVKRSMQGAESKKVFPEIQLVQVPVARGKADLNSYRNAGSEVVSILSRKGLCERASIDEVYLDLNDAAETMLAEAPPESLEEIEEEALKSHVLGLDNEDGSEAKENVRKWLCKSNADLCDKLLACGALIVAELGLLVLKETEFTCSAGIAHNKVQHWLNELCEDLSERLQLDSDENKRIAHTLVLHATAYKASDSDSQKKFPSKSSPLRYGAAKIQEDALSLFQAALCEYLGLYTAKIQGSQNNRWGVTPLSVSASKILPIPSGTASIAKYFHGHQPSSSRKQSQDNFIEESSPMPPSGNENYSEVNVTTPQIEFPYKETTIKYAVPSLHQLEGKKDLLNDQKPCCSPKNQG
ncbi:DNA polymerase eta isoform X1 [Rosa chinensis]|uniref:DNA polymerase eta isoform X1 n=1 Tax=Rosa chinensis TaxID=74649 RepID=UPI001AD8F088|nr:DNA polymerase eta isoform X1 [Rosa chinensis]XP_040373590.1 DNA polymerase eta isoform X1 [Rosa chinensis]XP_040373591.1 DNA polymerase eta isoform X1 [Rosa chinensis]